MALQSFDFEHTWWRLFQKYVVRTKFDMHNSIHIGEFRFRALGYVPLFENEKINMVQS